MVEKSSTPKIDIASVGDNDLIMAIGIHGGIIKILKYVRHVTGCNLADAKETVNAWRAANPEFDRCRELLSQAGDVLRNAYVPEGSYDLQDYNGRRQYHQDHFNFTSNIGHRDLCDVLCVQAAARAKRKAS